MSGVELTAYIYRHVLEEQDCNTATYWRSKLDVTITPQIGSQVSGQPYTIYNLCHPSTEEGCAIQNAHQARRKLKIYINMIKKTGMR